MKPPLWLILHAAAHASMASTEQLFLIVTEPRSGSDWLVDLLDAHPNVCVPAGRWAEKGSGDKHNGIDGHALVGVSKANALNRTGADVGAAYEEAAAYRLAHPLKGPKDDKGIRHRKACAAFGWKQPMHVLVPTYQPHAHARATIDRDSFAAWVRIRRVRLVFLKRTGLVRRGVKSTAKSPSTLPSNAGVVDEPGEEARGRRAQPGEPPVPLFGYRVRRTDGFDKTIRRKLAAEDARGAPRAWRRL